MKLFVARDWSGDLHVHKEGCRDLKQQRKYPQGDRQDGWPIEAETRREAILDTYPPGDFVYDEDDPEDWAAYMGAMEFFPCTKL